MKAPTLIMILFGVILIVVGFATGLLSLFTVNVENSSSIDSSTQWGLITLFFWVVGASLLIGSVLYGRKKN